MTGVGTRPPVRDGWENRQLIVADKHQNCTLCHLEMMGRLITNPIVPEITTWVHWECWLGWWDAHYGIFVGPPRVNRGTQREMVLAVKRGLPMATAFFADAPRDKRYGWWIL